MKENNLNNLKINNNEFENFSNKRAELIKKYIDRLNQCKNKNKQKFNLIEKIFFWIIFFLLFLFIFIIIVVTFNEILEDLKERQEIRQIKQENLKNSKEWYYEEEVNYLIKEWYYEEETNCQDFLLEKNINFPEYVILEWETSFTKLDCQEQLKFQSYLELYKILIKLKDNWKLYKLKEKKYQNLIITINQLIEELNLDKEIYWLQNLFKEKTFLLNPERI